MIIPKGDYLSTNKHIAAPTLLRSTPHSKLSELALLTNSADDWKPAVVSVFISLITKLLKLVQFSMSPGLLHPYCVLFVTSRVS